MAPVLLIACHAPVTAATADTAATSQAKPIAGASEEFGGTAASILKRVNSGLGPHPDSPLTRAFAQTGAAAVFGGPTAKGTPFAGIASRLTAGYGIAGINCTPLTPAERKSWQDAVTAMGSRYPAAWRPKAMGLTHGCVSLELPQARAFRIHDGFQIQYRRQLTRRDRYWDSDWMFSYLPVDKPGLEIDICEAFKEGGRHCQTTIHNSDKSMWTADWITPVDQRKGMHTVGIRIDGMSVVPMFDGRDVQNLKVQHVVGGKWTTMPAGTKLPLLPEHFARLWVWDVNVVPGGTAGKYDPLSSSDGYLDSVRVW